MKICKLSIYVGNNQLEIDYLLSVNGYQLSEPRN